MRLWSFNAFVVSLFCPFSLLSNIPLYSLWKLIHRKLTENGIGSLKERTLTQMSLNTTVKDIACISNRKWRYMTSSARGRKYSSLFRNTWASIRLFKLSPWKVTILQTFSFLQWILCLQQLSSPKSIKEHLSCFSGLAHGFPLEYMPWISVLCCSQINTFCWRNSRLFVASQQNVLQFVYHLPIGCLCCFQV